ncbi:SMI1/KNR4 family protein [Paraburkholderia fungorum]|uniref:SMI1/KNR4 family protein n=1 Tax=Paraburkholderia fungorum TaxID=134537 RepID=UPI001C7DD2A3|nr:SMI1/KNR4 family protein [Paraburkholderia fungorum]
MDWNKIYGKVFHDDAGEEYGVIRTLPQGDRNELFSSSFKPFAVDDCGNYFLRTDDGVSFWDHETGNVTRLAASENAFIDRLTEPRPVTLEEGQVRRAWIDPDFLKRLNKK